MLLVSTVRWSPGVGTREVGDAHVCLDGALGARDAGRAVALDASSGHSGPLDIDKARARVDVEGVAGNGHANAGRDLSRHPELVAVHKATSFGALGADLVRIVVRVFSLLRKTIVRRL
jgi:hypothetical protein